MLASMGREHRLRILHISDLHARESTDWRRRRVLGTAWEENLAALRQDGPFDLVCVTGDLAFSGEAAEYASVTDFLDVTLQGLDCSWCLATTTCAAIPSARHGRNCAGS
jgi:3',5'-cyclic AMP phosphodiesterase CpdA